MIVEGLRMLFLFISCIQPFFFLYSFSLCYWGVPKLVRDILKHY